MKTSELDRVDNVIRTAIPVKACDRFGLSCSFCRQNAPLPSPHEPDRSSEDWDGTKAKAREQTYSLIKFIKPNPQTKKDQIMALDDIDFSKLNLRQDDPKEEKTEVTDSLIPPPAKTETSEDKTKDTNREDLSVLEKRLQIEEEKYHLYDRIYIGQFSEEESDTNSDGMTYKYFD